MRLSSRLCIASDGNDGTSWSVLAEQVSGPSRGGDDDDGGSQTLGGGFDGGDGDRLLCIGWDGCLERQIAEELTLPDGGFSFPADAGHCADALQWIISLGGFTGQHNAISSV